MRSFFSRFKGKLTELTGLANAAAAVFWHDSIHVYFIKGELWLARVGSCSANCDISMLAVSKRTCSMFECSIYSTHWEATEATDLKNYRRRTQHVSILPVWSHPGVQKTQPSSLAGNSDTNSVLVAKTPSVTSWAGAAFTLERRRSARQRHSEHSSSNAT